MIGYHFLFIAYRVIDATNPIQKVPYPNTGYHTLLYTLYLPICHKVWYKEKTITKQNSIIVLAISEILKRYSYEKYATVANSLSKAHNISKLKAALDCLLSVLLVIGLFVGLGIILILRYLPHPF